MSETLLDTTTSGRADYLLVPADGQHRRIANMRHIIHRYLDTVIDSGTSLLGVYTQDLEKTLGQRWGGKAVATSSGTESLHFSLRVAGIGPGDEVIVPDMTFVSTAFAVNAAHAVPVFVDVEPDTWLISPDAIRRAITPKTRAIIPVHLYGQIADMDAIMAIAEEYGLVVIEDCAQAHDATYRGRPAGSFGDFGCFSMWVGKNIGGLDDGGFVVTKTDEHHVAMQRMHNLGRDRTVRYLHHSWGSRARMSELNAAVVRHQLEMLPEWNRQRQLIAAAYDKAFADLPLRTPTVLPDRAHVFYKYTVQTERSAELESHLAARRIATERIYPYLLSQQPAFANLPHRVEPTPVASANNTQLLCLPMYPELSYEEQIAVISGVRSFFEDDH